jgi:glycosyltransferase involved in cell wall biosynthesis
VKIEMVLPSLEVGGMEAVAAGLGRQLRMRGHEVGFTCTQTIGEIGAALIREGFDVAHVPAPGLLTNVAPTALTRHLRTRRPDITHVHSGVLLKAAVAARRAGQSAVLFTIHGLFPGERRYVRFLTGRAAARATEIVAVSEPIREYLCQKIRVRVPVTVVMNGVDTEKFSPGPRSGALREPHDIPADAVLFGNIARFDPRKNQAALLRAFDAAFRDDPGVHLALVGWGPERERLEDLRRSLAAAARIHIAPPHLDPVQLFRDIDFFVLPSLTEGTSMSLLEAMACGVPVIATAVGATPDVLENGRFGYLLKGTDVDSIRRGLDAAVGDPHGAMTMASGGRDRVCAHFSGAAVASCYEGIYQRCVAPTPP